MKYYKIIQDGTFIGVVCSNDFVKYQTRNHFYMRTDETDGEFVKYNGVLYRNSWMPPVPNEAPKPFEQASVIEITQEEYEEFADLIERHEEVTNFVEQDIVPYVFVDEDPIEGITVDFARTLKLAELSAACRAAIEDGFDIVLSDNVSHHFSLDTQDQLNLLSLAALSDTEEEIPYHADGELCKFYTAAEIKRIVAAANNHKMYHTTYYNALKNYVNSLDTADDIIAVMYGDELSEEYQTEVLKALS